jgi:hypothetical protein
MPNSFVRGAWSVGFWGHDLNIVQGPEVAVVNFSCNLVANFDAFDYVFLVRNVDHGHGIHPTFDLLPIDRECLSIYIDLLNLPTKGVLLLACGRRILVLLGKPARKKQSYGYCN